MTEPGDPVSRRYRELAREEPSSALDAAILARARKSVGARPRSAARWMGPVSIAAVLVLGIGVSLRMQLEQPGVETSVPSPVESQLSKSAAPAASPPAKPAAPEPAPAPEAARDAAAPAKQASAERGRMKEDRMELAAPRTQAQLRGAPADAVGAGARSEPRAAAQGEANPFADGPVAVQQAPSGATTPGAALGYAPPLEEKTRAKLSADLARAPAPAPAAAAAGSVAPMPAPAAPATVAPATIAAAPAPPPAPAAVRDAVAPQASAAPSPAMPSARPAPASPALARVAPPQPKREDYSANTAERELKKSIVAAEPDPDPARELERIAKLREAGAQGEADRALEAFRRRHPDFRIPEAMWERVKPR